MHAQISMYLLTVLSQKDHVKFIFYLPIESFDSFSSLNLGELRYCKQLAVTRSLSHFDQTLPDTDLFIRENHIAIKLKRSRKVTLNMYLPRCFKPAAENRIIQFIKVSSAIFWQSIFAGTISLVSTLK